MKTVLENYVHWVNDPSNHQYIIGGLAFLAVSIGLYSLTPSQRRKRQFRQLCKNTSSLRVKKKVTDADGNPKPDQLLIPMFSRYKKLGDYGFQFNVKFPHGLSHERFAKHDDVLRSTFDAERVSIDLDGTKTIVKVIKKNPLAGDVELSTRHALTASSSSEPVTAIAVDEHGNDVIVDWSKQVSALAGGQTGAGKTAAVRFIICSVINTLDADVVAIDPLEADTIGLKALGYEVVSSNEDAVALLGRVKADISSRVKVLVEHNAANITELPDGVMRHLFVSVDELHNLFTHGRDKASKDLAYKAEDLLHSILATGRKVGVHGLLATQKPTTDSIPSRLRDLCAIKIAFRCETSEAQDAILGSGASSAGADATNISAQTPGVAVMKIDGSVQANYVRVKFPFIKSFADKIKPRQGGAFDE